MTENKEQDDKANNSTNPFDAYFSSQEAKDDFIDGLVRFEQIEARLPNHARLVAVYYHALIKEGLPADGAFILARDYSNALMRYGY